uniref:Reverse transcriptase Ty1/copia-type domain-containing protein n=1 Tax=Cannabis sativa TaxID=3483 RepID=A0A803PLP9_CANSA
MLAIVVQFDLELEQIDVKITFLHGEVEEVIFMEQPKGYEEKSVVEMVCKLQKSLGYGIKDVEYLFMCVDNMLLISKEKAKIGNLKRILETEFDLKDLGNARRILGIDIKRSKKREKLTLCQENYIRKIHEQSREGSLVGHEVDATIPSWDSRKFTSAFQFLVCGNCVNWRSQLQPTVALSNTEAEFIAGNVSHYKDLLRSMITLQMYHLRHSEGT